MKFVRRRWPWLVGAGLVAALAAGLLLRSSGDGASVDPQLLLTVRKTDLVVEVLDTGRIQPRRRVEVKSKVAGQALEVLVKEGEQVKKGQLLLRLDPTDLQREVARADADLAQAQNALEFAQLSLARKRRGLEDRGVAQLDVDLAANEVRAKQAAVRMAQVALAAAQDRLRYTEIVSPIDGTVIERSIEPGEVVVPGIQATFEGRALLSVADLSTLVVRAELNQIDVAKIQLDQTVRLSLDALPGRSYEARVTKVAPASVKPKGRDVEVFPVEAELQLADSAIKPGMTADVRFLVETRRATLPVPIEAIVKDAGKTYVNKVALAQGKPSMARTEVTLGSRNDREVEVLTGLVEGEQLMINPGSSAANEAKL